MIKLNPALALKSLDVFIQIFMIKKIFGISAKNHRKVLNWLYFTSSIILFLVGIILKLLPKLIGEEKNEFLEIISELGTFLALIFSIHLVYEIFVKRHERNIIISEIRGEMSETLQHLITANADFLNSGLVGYYDKLPFREEMEKKFENAKEIRILQTWSGLGTNIYDPIRTALKKGAEIKILLLSPESDFCLARSKDLHQEPDYVSGEITNEFKKLRSIINEKIGNGKMELKFYDATPTMPIYIVDETVYFGHLWRKEFSATTPYFKATLTLDEISTPSRIGKLIEVHFNDLWVDSKTKIASTTVKGITQSIIQD